MNPLAQVLAPTPPPFALLSRGDGVDVLLGAVSEVDSIDDLPLRETGTVLALVPYRQITERGYVGG